MGWLGALGQLDGVRVDVGLSERPSSQRASTGIIIEIVMVMVVDYTNRRRHLALVFTDARAHGTRPHRHCDHATKVIPLHRRRVHAAGERVLLLL